MRSNKSSEESDPKMAAGSKDPRIGVYALSEFMYCPRAGLLALELGETTEDCPHERTQRLDYSPLYFSEYQIVMRLKSALAKFWSSVVAALFFGGVTCLFGFHFSLLIRLVLIVATLSFGWLGYMMWLEIARLTPTWSAAKNAVPGEPVAGFEQCQDVNWWELRKAGFEAVPCRDRLVDDHWRIVGKPWRILRRGSLRIPVFRLRHTSAKLYPQHYARMAAYCHLLELCEGQESPYGIILFPDSYDGQSVPNAPWTRKYFQDGLRRARAVVQDNDPSPPKRSLCVKCPLGRPRIVGAPTQRLSAGKQLKVYNVHADDGSAYHSLCGDRFRWIPPHEHATAIGLGRSQ